MSASQFQQCSLHDWAALQLQLLFAFNSDFTPGSVDGEYERHGELSAWLIRSGHIDLVSDGDQVTVRPGQWLFCRGRRIRQKLAAETRILTLRFALSWPDEVPVFSSESSICLLEAADYPHLEVAAEELVADVSAVEFRRENPAYTFLWRTRLNQDAFFRHQRHLFEWMELLTGILETKGWRFRIPRGIDSRLASALFLLENLPHDHPFPTGRLTTGGFLTLGQLNRMCLRSLGTTLFGYWEQGRLAHAKILLADPAKSVKEVASALGFSQLSHFSTWFKRLTTQSPRAFRVTSK